MARCEDQFVEWMTELADAVGRTNEANPKVVASICCRAGRRRSPAAADFIERMLERTMRCEVHVILVDFRPCEFERAERAQR